MARPRKRGLEYFPFDVDFFSDKKIKVLKGRFGADGVMIYIYLLCEVYKEGHYIKMDKDYEYVIADDLGMSDEKVKQVVKFLLERSLLDDKLFQSDTIITSQGIQRRFQEAIKTRATKLNVEVEPKYWLLSENETQPFIKFTQNPDYSEKNPNYSEKNPDYSEKNATKKSKEKKIKVKKNKEISSELKNSPRPEAVYKLLMVDGNYHPVTREEVEKYKELYPAVDVDQEFRKMIGWLDANPNNRKTPRGIRKFVNGWLSRAQDSARPDRYQQTSLNCTDLAERLKKLNERRNEY